MSLHLGNLALNLEGELQICRGLSPCWNRLTELRTQKQKMSRQVRDRDEELDEQRPKMESLRQELRKADKAKREVRRKQHGWREGS